MTNKAKAAKVASFQLIALGANVSIDGEALALTLANAIKAISQAGLAIRSVSRFFSTPCFPAGAGPSYVNAAIAVQSNLNADEILRRLHAIETDFGRKRVQRWGQRTLDLDLIAMGDLVLPDVDGFNAWRALDPDLQAKAAPDGLVLPHPRLQDRAFVLVPLADIAASWKHPVLDLTVNEMLARIDTSEVSEIIPL